MDDTAVKTRDMVPQIEGEAVGEPALQALIGGAPAGGTLTAAGRAAARDRLAAMGLPRPRDCLLYTSPSPRD